MTRAAWIVDELLATKALGHRIAVATRADAAGADEIDTIGARRRSWQYDAN
jgi:hypothetical protein